MHISPACKMKGGDNVTRFNFLLSILTEKIEKDASLYVGGWLKVKKDVKQLLVIVFQILPL